jgi:hypothetical protein
MCKTRLSAFIKGWEVRSLLTAGLPVSSAAAGSCGFAPFLPA